MTVHASPTLDAGAPAAARQGARTALSYAVAFAPYGLVIGAMARQSSIGPLAGWSSAWLLYGGTSQVIAMQLLESGATVVAVVTTIALFNVRVAAYSIAMAPRWRSAPRWWIALASYVLLDPAYVIADQRWDDDGDSMSPEQLAWHRHYYFAAAVTLWAAWLAVCGAGAIAGELFASSIPAALVAELMLATMVALLARTPVARRVAVVGFVFGLATSGIPGGLGPALSAVVAVAAVQVCRGARS